ncbi:hypothetical protein BBG08_01895 [Streptococcus dysgalactiae subsp. equisimilis]|nr:hypothetical protein BBG01_00940 [Streptococcus dysgalactiae subsp. equisimilis]OCX01840.1 hypothetical protein BBG10_06360 [Streptococcus dysgalactiae subsp. equisimilis]OCX03735.1 hypothetical protein BBG08_01895 [Streptococcus dysgalactiae subsp. equisimilis]
MLLITVQLITEIYDEVIPEQQKCDQILLIKIKKHLMSMNKVSSARCWNFVHHRNRRVFLVYYFFLLLVLRFTCLQTVIKPLELL